MQRPSGRLASGLANPRWPERPADQWPSGLREAVRRWLQMFVNQSVADEFDSRITRVLDSLRKWETDARIRAEATHQLTADERRRGELIDIFGEPLCDRFNEIIDDAQYTADYIRQLAWMVKAKLDAQAKEAPAEKSDGLTGKQAAAIIGITPGAVCRAAGPPGSGKGILDNGKKGQDRRYDPDSVAKYAAWRNTRERSDAAQS